MKNKWIAFTLLGLLIVVGGLYVYSVLRPKPPKREITIEQTIPQFRLDGYATVMDSLSGDTLKSLEIEIANDAYEITTGLMFRKHMEENRGMLFIFPDVDMRSFWMKNTVIPLDIVFISANKRIVNVQANTTPFSEKSIPSTGPAKYVLEVNAGTASKYNWKPGDRFEWSTK